MNLRRIEVGRERDATRSDEVGTSEDVRWWSPPVVSLRDNQGLGCHGSSRNNSPYGTLGWLATHEGGEGGLEGATNELAWPLCTTPPGMFETGGGRRTIKSAWTLGASDEIWRPL